MTLRLNGDGSGFTEIKAPNAAGDNSITLPTSNGGANQLLQNGGTAGELQYTSAAGGLVYDSTGRLMVNTNSVGTDNFSINSPLQVQAGSGAYALAIRNRAGNDYGFISFGSTDGNEQLANIFCERTTTNTANLYFATNGGNASTNARIAINSDGTLRLINTPGIDFSGIQTNAAGMASETLDCYEEGTWSPVLAGQSTAGTMELVSGGSVGGQYTKIGNYFVARAAFSNVFLTGASGNLILTGLPFACVSAKGGAGGYVQYLEGFDPAYSNSFDGSDAIVMRQLSAASVNFRPQYANKWDTYVNAPNTLFQRSGGSSSQRMYGDIVLYGFTD